MRRQVRWQREAKRKGLCPVCGKPAIPNTLFCVHHWLIRTAKRHGRAYSTSKAERELQKLVDEAHCKANVEIQISEEEIEEVQAFFKSVGIDCTYEEAVKILTIAKGGQS